MSKIVSSQQHRINMHVACVMKKKYLTRGSAEAFAKRAEHGIGKQWAYICPKCKKYHLTTHDPAIYEQKIKERNEKNADWAEFLGVEI